MGDLTSFLYAKPSVIEGLARVLDASGTLNEYNQSSTPEQADRRALRADWKAVGEDLRRAIMEVANDISEQRGTGLAGGDLKTRVHTMKGRTLIQP